LGVPYPLLTHWQPIETLADPFFLETCWTADASPIKVCKYSPILRAFGMDNRQICQLSSNNRGIAGQTVAGQYQVGERKETMEPHYTHIPDEIDFR